MKWDEKGLDELGLVARGRSRHRPRDAAHLYGGPFPFVQTGDIKRADLYLTTYSQSSRPFPENWRCLILGNRL
jgi:type I restriction enzyme S subunit